MPIFQDKVVVVTGASSGIGRSIATAFAERGAHVVLVARREARLRELADELVHLAASTLVIAADVGRTDDLERVAQQTLEKYGRVDVLVNNAGVGGSGRFDAQPSEHVAKLIDVNLYAPLYLTRLFLPTFREQNSGHIVFISSMAGEMRVGGSNTYAATKAGLSAFADALRRELLPTQIHVANVLPGFTHTPMVSTQTRAEALRQLRKQGLMLPGMRYDEPQDVALAVVNAVRYRQSTVMMGGALLRVLAWVARLSPQTIDTLQKNVAVGKMGDM